MMKIKFKLKLLICAIMVGSIIITAFFFQEPKKDIIEIGITALEAKSIADQIAYNWSKDALLYSVNTNAKMVTNGTFTNWCFDYFLEMTFSFPVSNPYGSNPNGIYLVERRSVRGLHVLINSNGSAETSFEDITNSGTQHCLLPAYSDFEIDSNEAYLIATTNKTINIYLQNDTGYPIYQLSNISANPVWSIEWMYFIPGDPAMMVPAYVQINAITGEIIRVLVSDSNITHFGYPIG